MVDEAGYLRRLFHAKSRSCHLEIIFIEASSTAMPMLTLVIHKGTPSFSWATKKSEAANMTAKTNGHDKNTTYAHLTRLRIAQRSTLLVVAGAWSVDFFLSPSASIALALNLVIGVSLIAAIFIQVLLVRRS